MIKRLVCGVGINDADYKVSEGIVSNGKWKVTWVCPYYDRWKSMLRRCYSEKELDKCPTYKDCSVCEEWLTFSNFKRWMEKQKWEGRSLDKDFLIGGNKVYSPATCVFIPQELNTFTITSGKIRGLCPLGVCYRKRGRRMVNEHSKPYLSQVSNLVRGVSIRTVHQTPEEAHQAYLNAKLKQCNDYIEELKDEPLIAKGLTRIKDKIQYHIDNNLELTSF